MNKLLNKDEIKKLPKFLKAMFKDESRFGGGVFKYKIGEVNVANIWNPSEENSGGFNFSTEDQIARWIVRGDTLYDVIIPEDAEVILAENPSTPNGVYRSNKIIVLNPRKITDSLALELFLKSNLPEKTYYKTLAGYAVRGYINSCKEIIRQKVNKNNIDLVISEFEDFLTPKGEKFDQSKIEKKSVTEIVRKMLYEIKGY